MRTHAFALIVFGFVFLERLLEFFFLNLILIYITCVLFFETIQLCLREAKTYFTKVQETGFTLNTLRYFNIILDY